MATFNFNDYQKAVNAAQNKDNSSNVRVGWFKLADDGDEALVRINLSDVSEMQFATIHQLGVTTNWMKVSCTDEFGSYEKTCPLCAAANAGNTQIGKASKRVYVPMLVSYKDKVTGQWSAPQPVIWDKPAGFSREIANKIRDFGDLRQVMFKVRRNGAARDMKTTYSIDYAMPTVFKPEMIPTDFSAFNNFKVDKHSFWVKTVDEINTFLSTGSFPERTKSEDTPTYSSEPTSQPTTYQAPVTPAPQPTAAPVAQSYVPPVASQTYTTPAPQAEPQQTTNKFNGFSF